jgi:head-tail adaptor
MRHSVTIQVKGTPTQGTRGEPIFSWSTFATAIMEVRALSSRETFNFGQRFPNVSVKMSGYFLPGITVEMRAVDSCCLRTFDIKSVDDPDGTRRTMNLLCEEIF